MLKSESVMYLTSAPSHAPSGQGVQVIFAGELSWNSSIVQSVP